MDARQVGNSWVPVLGLGVLFLTGAAADLMDPEGDGAVAPHYVVGTLLLTLLTALWFLRHPPALRGTRGAYGLVAVLIEAGVLLGGAGGALRGCMPWLILGLGTAWFGRLERARAIVAAGVVTACAGLLAVLIDVPVLSGVLQGLTATVFGVLAWRLYVMKHGRREPPRGVDLASLKLR